MSSKAYRIVGLPDYIEGRYVLEVEETHLGQSETQLTYAYYDRTGAELAASDFETDYWGRIKGVRVIREVRLDHDNLIAIKELNP